MKSPTPHRPASHAEGQIVQLILGRAFPTGTHLPSERDLARKLGVTRPTLREALQRLHRDGWIEIQHGKSTRVRDIWKEGGLNVLDGVVRHGGALPTGFVTNLLEVRASLAPAYARAAVERNALLVQAHLDVPQRPADDAASYSRFDWQLHLFLSHASQNPVFTLILNGFSELYPALADSYFESSVARRASRQFYDALQDAARTVNPSKAERVTRAEMEASVERWTEVEHKVRARGGKR